MNSILRLKNSWIVSILLFLVFFGVSTLSYPQSSFGNTTITGTLKVTGATTLAGLNAGTTYLGTTSLGNATLRGVLDVDRAATLRSTLSVVSNFSVNTNKFTVAGISGNTAISGALNVTGATTTSRLTNSGDISTATLSSSSQATLNSVAIANNASVGGNFTVGSKIVNNDNVVSIGQNAIQIVSGADGVDTGRNDRITTDGLAPGGPDLHLGGFVISSGGLVSSTPVHVQVDGILVANNGIAIGGTAGTSTVNFNSNRIQNIASAVIGTDAVNLNQVNSLITSSANNLQSQIDQNNLVAQRGIAGVSAIAGIPAIEAGKNFSIGVGVGNYVSASAISVGAQARVARSTVLKVAAGTTTFGGIVTSAGLGFSF